MVVVIFCLVYFIFWGVLFFCCFFFIPSHHEQTIYISHSRLIEKQLLCVYLTGPNPNVNNLGVGDSSNPFWVCEMYKNLQLGTSVALLHKRLLHMQVIVRLTPSPIDQGRKCFYLTTHSIHFILRLYGVGHMVKDNSDSERRNSLPPHGLLFPINSKGSFICTIPQTGYHIPQPLVHQL